MTSPLGANESQPVEANGLTHTSPGQRLGIPAPNNHPALKGLLIACATSIKSILSYGAISTAAIILTATPVLSATFEEQRKAISSSIETQPEAAILSLLKSGIEEAKPTQAIAEARKWLRQNLPEDAMLLFYAGRAAELSGDASGAAALYQQYLTDADPKAETTGQAVIATHALLKDQLNDPDAAYSFNKAVGNRLASNPTLRQFDPWFLDEATDRKDSIAVANRLHALIKAGVSEDLLTTFYDTYFRWLLEQENVYVEQRTVAPSTEELVAAYKQLAAAMTTFNEELALRLDWAVSVRAYNQAKIAGKDVAPPIAEAKALLEKYPRYAHRVQNGWAGGGNSRHYRNDPAKYWPHEIEAKMAPVVAAAAKLTPLQLADLMASWREGYYEDRVVRPTAVKAVRDVYHFTRYADKLNTRNGVLIFGKEWNKFTPEEAQTLAPKLAESAHPEVSLIRAIAAGGEEKDLNKMIAALIGPEAWRLSATELDSRYADQLWRYAGKPGNAAVRDQKIAESKAVADQIKSAALDLKAAPAQRLALFKKLWATTNPSSRKSPASLTSSKRSSKSPRKRSPNFSRTKVSKHRRSHETRYKPVFWAPIRFGRNWKPPTKSMFQATRPAFFISPTVMPGGSSSELKKRQPQKYIPHPARARIAKIRAGRPEGKESRSMGTDRLDQHAASGRQRRADQFDAGRDQISALEIDAA